EQRCVAEDAERREAIAEKAHRMVLQRQAGRHVILDNQLAERHGGKRDRRFREKLLTQMWGEERQRLIFLARRWSRFRRGGISSSSELALLPPPLLGGVGRGGAGLWEGFAICARPPDPHP